MILSIDCNLNQLILDVEDYWGMIQCHCWYYFFLVEGLQDLLAMKVLYYVMNMLLAMFEIDKYNNLFYKKISNKPTNLKPIIKKEKKVVENFN